ncbi:MAG: ATP-binding protein [Sneathiella sp.]|nr:ATP-binding protein [Sneathiella sp.]
MTDETYRIETIAPLLNVANFLELVERVINSPNHLPSMAVFYGYSGFGKTFSAKYAARMHRALFLEVGYSWTISKFCNALLSELGCELKGTISGKIDRIIDALKMAPNRPLIIDEFDHFMTKNGVEIVREIHDKTDTPIILIGEELLPQSLKQFERFHNRIIAWEPALQTTMEDAKELAKIHCPDILIDENLLHDAFKASGGRVRRICTNLALIQEEADNAGIVKIGQSEWGSKPFFVGQPPVRRRFA